MRWAHFVKLFETKLDLQEIGHFVMMDEAVKERKKKKERKGKKERKR